MHLSLCDGDGSLYLNGVRRDGDAKGGADSGNERGPCGGSSRDRNGSGDFPPEEAEIWL